MQYSKILISISILTPLCRLHGSQSINIHHIHHHQPDALSSRFFSPLVQSLESVLYSLLTAHCSIRVPLGAIDHSSTINSITPTRVRVRVEPCKWTYSVHVITECRKWTSLGLDRIRGVGTCTCTCRLYLKERGRERENISVNHMNKQPNPQVIRASDEPQQKICNLPSNLLTQRQRQHNTSTSTGPQSQVPSTKYQVPNVYNGGFTIPLLIL